MPDHRLLFVGGLHRSGTTLLARCLAAHPAVSGLTGTGVAEDEGQHLQSVYPPAGRWGGPGRFGFRAGAHLTESSPLADPANRDRIFAAWAPFWDLSRPVLLEKSPPNLLMSRFLQALFPAAHFVFLLRHPAAVALASAKWSHTPLSALVDHWLHCHELLLEDLPHLRGATLLRYEDLLADPAGCVMRICTAVGLGAPPALPPVRGGGNAEYLAAWAALVRRGEPAARSLPPGAAGRTAPGNRRERAGRLVASLLGQRWQLVDRARDAADAAVRFERRARRFGYSLLDAAAPPGPGLAPGLAPPD